MPDHRPWASVALHASAVRTRHGALLFLGHSGEGKSTIRQLLAPRLASVADDAVYLLHRGAETWYVGQADQLAFAGPLPADEVKKLEWIPLQAVARIRQATENRLEPLPSPETCRHLADAAFEIKWQRRQIEVVRQAFAHVAQVARNYPGWELYFTRSPGTVELVAGAFG